MKNNIIYKGLSILTVVAPTIIYLFLSATLFNVKPDFIFYLVDYDIQEVTHYENNIFFHSPNASYNGLVSYNEELGVYGVFLEEGNIISSQKSLYVVEANKETKALEINGINKFALNKKEKISLPLAFLFLVCLA